MIKKKASAMFVLVFLILVGQILTASAQECFTIVVGKDVSTDGYVIMAHNEDDSPPVVVNHHKVPRKKYAAEDKVQLVNGGELEQVPETWSYIWAEMPGMLFSDSYLNEWGVCIASDRCPSRENKPKLTDGGISYMLRRLVAERAKSAREGVLLAGELVERFGYASTGRTYTICDPDEGWLFCAVNGKHWLAQRVPDDHIAMIANTYTVREVDLSDTNNVLASADIVDYAISRGWYNPEEDESFDFAAAYADPRAATDSANFCRQWSGLRYVTTKPACVPDLPFSVLPERKFGVKEIMPILRDHYEQTPIYRTDPETGNPHTGGSRTICTWTTQTSFIAQLRRGMSADVGLVYWVCLAPPCASVYVPFHFGIPKFPDAYSTVSETPTEEYFRQRVAPPFAADTPDAFWLFSNFYYSIAEDYDGAIERAMQKTRKVETAALALQKQLEERARSLYPADTAAARKLLYGYSASLYGSAREALETAATGK